MFFKKFNSRLGHFKNCYFWSLAPARLIKKFQILSGITERTKAAGASLLLLLLSLVLTLFTLLLFASLISSLGSAAFRAIGASSAGLMRSDSAKCSLLSYTFRLYSLKRQDAFPFKVSNTFRFMSKSYIPASLIWAFSRACLLRLSALRSFTHLASSFYVPAIIRLLWSHNLL